MRLSFHSLYYAMNIALPSFALANGSVIAVDNHSVDDLTSQRRLQLRTDNPFLDAQTSLKPLSKAELLNQPHLLLETYVTALKTNDMHAVEVLLPLYQQQPEADSMLLQWGEAMLAQKRANFTQSIDLYRDLIAKQPNAQAVRLQLAIALLRNRQNEAARGQFEKLRNEKLPSSLSGIVENYLQRLQKQDEFQFFVSANYLHEANVNNAPKAGTKIEGFTPSSKPEKAEGLNYWVNMNKNWSFTKGLFSEWETDINGKYYWHNGKYNELSVRNALGMGYRNANTELKFAPFVEQFWYAGGERAKSHRLHRHSYQLGGEMTLAHWLTHQWKSHSRVEYSQQRYHHAIRHGANGQNVTLNQTMSFFANSRQSWSVGLDYQYRNAINKVNAFQRYGVRLGWSQEWLKGISSYVQLNYAQRHYQQASAKPNDRFAPSFFKVAQKNHEYGLNVTLWQRNLHWKGITPKVTWAYQKVSSNNLFAHYDRHRIYLTLSKGF